MKFVAAMVSALSAPLAGRSLRALVRLLVLIVGAVLLFSFGFHLIMTLEGREHTWWTAIYWTLVTMSTLGFGDIVFESDLGRMYSVLVLVCGAILILVLLPFTFIQLVYLPWRAATREARAPRSLPDDVSGHLLVTGREPMEEALIQRAVTAGVPYAVLVEDVDEAIALHEEGYSVMVGQLDDPGTYRRARVDRAALVVAARSDQANTNIAFSAREVTDAGVVVATATSEASVDVLELAGADRVLQLGPLLGRAFARRILAPTARSREMRRFENLVIAEASAAGTELVGRSLAELELRTRLGVTVVGVWNRGTLEVARGDLVVEDSSILILAGTEAGIAAYDDAFAPDDDPTGGNGAPEFVVILGGGRVGRATASALREAGTPCRIVEQREERVRHLPPDQYVVGDAADLEVLREAGIEEATGVVITTHDDDMNVYLTLYCRKLRPSAEILGRVNLDRNLSTMYRAGADFVLSYASTGATEAWNTLRGDSTLLLAEGLVVFRVTMPQGLVGRSLAEVDLPGTTGASVVATARAGVCSTDFDANAPLPADADLILIGDDEAESAFLTRYVAAERNGGLRSWLRRRLTRSPRS